MKNILKNAKFRDRFRTSDGKMAIYSFCIKGRPNEHYLIVDRNSSLLGGYTDDGIINACGYHNPNLDIVSKWQEPINEEELVESATKDCGRIVGMTGEITMSHVLQAYKKGYMKRVEEE